MTLNIPIFDPWVYVVAYILLSYLVIAILLRLSGPRQDPFVWAISPLLLPIGFISIGITILSLGIIPPFWKWSLD